MIRDLLGELMHGDVQRVVGRGWNLGDSFV